ncbi:hypothetical protein SRHO_G00110160 [Serrasalmus rhombeus]
MSNVKPMRVRDSEGPRGHGPPPTRLERLYVFAHAPLNLCQGTKLALYRFQLYSDALLHDHDDATAMFRKGDIHHATLAV